MFIRVVLILLTLIFPLNLTSKTQKPKIVAIIVNNNGEIIPLTEISIDNFAEKDSYWYTGEDGFYKSALISETIEMVHKNNKFFIEFVRTGKEQVKNVKNLKFKGKNEKGKNVSYYLKEIKSIRFTSTKSDKICKIGHIWLNTDFIFCPYDGTILSGYEKKTY